MFISPASFIGTLNQWVDWLCWGVSVHVQLIEIA
jgi:hypothetical protein